MVDTIVNFEGVTPTGTSLSAANEAAISTLVSAGVSAGTGGSIKSLGPAALNGTTGIEMICGTTAVCIFDLTLTAGSQQRFHIPVKMPTTDFTGTTSIAQVYGDNGAGGFQIVLRLQIAVVGAAWNLVVTDLANAHVALAMTGIPDLSVYAGQYVAFGVLLDSNTLATNGKINVRFYPNPYSTTIAGTEATSTILSLGAGNMFRVLRLGFLSTQAAARTMWFDYVRHGNASTTYYGAVPAASLPVGVVTGDHWVERDSLAALDSSTSTGTITSRTWSAVHSHGGAVTNSSPSGVSTNISSTTPGQITVTMTPFNGASAGTPVTWIVYNRCKPGEDVDVFLVDTTTFSNAGTVPASSLENALNDENLSSWAQSTDTPAGQPIAFWLFPIGPGAINMQPVDRSFNGALGTGVTHTLYISKGGTQVYQFSYIPGVTTFAEKVQPVDSGGLAIADLISERQMMYVVVAPVA